MADVDKLFEEDIKSYEFREELACKHAIRSIEERDYDDALKTIAECRAYKQAIFELWYQRGRIAHEQ